MKKNIKTLAAIFSDNDTNCEIVYTLTDGGRTYTEQFCSTSAMLSWLSANKVSISLSKVFTTSKAI